MVTEELELRVQEALDAARSAGRAQAELEMAEREWMGLVETSVAFGLRRSHQLNAVKELLRLEPVIDELRARAEASGVELESSLGQLDRASHQVREAAARPAAPTRGVEPGLMRKLMEEVDRRIQNAKRTRAKP